MKAKKILWTVCGIGYLGLAFARQINGLNPDSAFAIFLLFIILAEQVKP